MNLKVFVTIPFLDGTDLKFAQSHIIVAIANLIKAMQFRERKGQYVVEFISANEIK